MGALFESMITKLESVSNNLVISTQKMQELTAIMGAQGTNIAVKASDTIAYNAINAADVVSNINGGREFMRFMPFCSGTIRVTLELMQDQVNASYPAKIWVDTTEKVSVSTGTYVTRTFDIDVKAGTPVVFKSGVSGTTGFAVRIKAGSLKIGYEITNTVVDGALAIITTP